VSFGHEGKHQGLGGADFPLGDDARHITVLLFGQ